MYTPGTLFDGRYLLKERKGRGSFGEVWLATDQQVGVDFAIKIYVAMNTKGLEEFRKEYQLSCNLINSNLLHINHMGVCQEDSCPYLVMPFCPRGSASLVGRMDEAMLWKYLHDVANGLSYLHTQTPPIVHQDIKPDNILQTQGGDFVITDFGISKQMRATMHSTGNDTSGAIAYMGPERFGRQYQTIKSSDIWSLGATMYELATGQLPFEGRGGGMLNAGAEVPDIPANYSAELNEVIRACMAKEPWDRPSAGQLVEIAAQALKGGPVSLSSTNTSAQAVGQPAQAAPVEAKSASSGGSRTAIIAICAVVAVALIGFIGYMLLGGKGNDTPSEPASKPAVNRPVNTPVQQHPVSGNTQPVQPTQPAQPKAETPTQPANTTPATNNTTGAKPQQSSGASTNANTKPAETKPAESKSSSGTVSVSYGSWTGGLKNGKPHGKGTMKFTRDYDLQGHAIKAGDTVTGECSNGKLAGYCKWHSQSNGDKSILLGE